MLADAPGEVARGLENVEFACGIPQLLKGGYSEQAATGVDVYSIRQPLGVVAGITPFNFPAMVPLWMCANAIACGNAFVLKPSREGPVAVAAASPSCGSEAGLPDGVFNVVQGDKVAVDALLDHPDIAAVSFVGSTPIARYVYETGTAHGKRVQALGGAKNHMVVLPDADLDLAADAAVSAGVRLGGGAVHGRLRRRGRRRRRRPAGRGDRRPACPKLRVGAGADPDGEMGPLITAEHRDRVARLRRRGRPTRAPSVVVDGRAGVDSAGAASSSAPRCSTA